MSDYRKLLIWQEAHQLTLEVYQASKTFPRDELFGLTSQLRRSSASVAANIAEGTGRDSQQELRRFCRIALGSLNETEYHLLLARDLGYVEADVHETLARHASRLRRMVVRFSQSLDRGMPEAKRLEKPLPVTGNR